MHELTEGLFVNQTMFEEAGIRIPQRLNEAWTWDQFVEIAKRLTKRTGDRTDVWGFGVLRHLSDWSILPVLEQHNATPLSPDLKKATGYVNSPAAVEAWRWYQDLFIKHKVISVDPIPEGFPAGKIAIFQAPSTYRAVLDKRYPDFKYAVVPMFKAKRCAVTAGGGDVSFATPAQKTHSARSPLGSFERGHHTAGGRGR